jgi:hypothetical protein
LNWQNKTHSIKLQNLGKLNIAFFRLVEVI